MKCGCYLDQVKGQAMPTPKIVYCPLHSAAEEMKTEIYKISSLLQSVRTGLKAENVCDMIETIICDLIGKIEATRQP